MRNLTYKILLTKEPEGSYTAIVPALPGCITYGENLEHAISMAREAIELYVEHLQAKGQPVPDDTDTLEYSINLQTA
jgi:antitoxin HicB